MKRRAWIAVLLPALWMSAPPCHEEILLQIEMLSEDLALEPDNTDLLLRRAWLHLEHEDPHPALEDAARVAAIDPERLDVLVVRGDANFQLRRLDEARADLDRYLAQAGPDYYAYTLRAKVRACDGDLAGAVEDLAAAAELWPLPEQYVERARLLLELGDVPGALAAYEEGIVTLDAPISLLLELVELTQALGLVDQAVGWAHVLEDRAGRAERWMLLRADILHQAGRHDLARDTYAEALVALRERMALGRVTQFMRMEQARALIGLDRLMEARAIFDELSPALRPLREYQTLADQLGVTLAHDEPDDDWMRDYAP